MIEFCRTDAFRQRPSDVRMSRAFGIRCDGEGKMHEPGRAAIERARLACFPAQLLERPPQRRVLLRDRACRLGQILHPMPRRFGLLVNFVHRPLLVETTAALREGGIR